MTRAARWKIFTLFAAMYVLAYFFRVSMAVAAHDVATDLSLSPAMLGTLSGAFFYAFAVAQIPLGPLLDRLGGRLIVSVTGLLTTAGSIFFALSGGFTSALGARILLGLGSASVLMGALKVFGNWYSSREFATVSGLIVAVGNLGNLSATAPLAAAIAAFGWRSPFLLVGVLQGTLVLLVYLLVRDHPDRGHGEAHPEHAPMGLVEGWRRVVSTPSFWLLSLLSFFWYASYMALQGLWGGPYLMEVLGLSRSGAGRLLLCTSLGFIVGCLGIGKLSTSIIRSRKWTLVLGQGLLLGLMMLFLGPAENLPPLLRAPVFFVIGLAVSSGVTIYPMIREMFPHAITATAMTGVNFFVLMGAATAQQVMGLVIGSYPAGPGGHSPAAFHGAFLVPVTGLAVAILFFLFATDTGPERK